MSNYNYYQNKGQLRYSNKVPIENEVLYYTNSNNPNIYVGSRRASFVMVKPDSIQPDSIARIDLSLPCSTSGGGENDYKGSADDPCPNIPVPVDKVPGHLNYYLGHTPKGVGKVYGYERLVFEKIYDNIDWHLYSNAMWPKMYFMVHPGGDPNNIVLKFEGQDSLKLDTISGLRAYMSDEFIYFPHATAFQVDAGGNIIPMLWVPVFNTPVNGETSFVIGNYDPSMKLVIQMGYPPYTTSSRADPADWSTEYGSWLFEESRDVETDGAGSVYMTGNTQSADFPTTPGVFQMNNENGQDGFIAKWDNLSVQEWTTYLGGDGWDALYGSALEGNNHIYVVGGFGPSLPPDSLPFPTANPGNGAYVDNTRSSGDAVIAKFNAVDGTYDWGTYFGGDGNEDVALDVTYKNDGHIYVVGETNSESSNVGCSVPGSNGDFTICNTSGGKYSDQSYNGGQSDGFIAKFDTSGVLNWSTYVGGNGSDKFVSADIDPDNRLVLLADSRDFGMPLQNLSGAYNDPHNGGADAYIARFNTSDALTWSTYFGSIGTDWPQAISTDDASNLYITGATFPSIGSPLGSSTGCNTPPTNGGFPLCDAGTYFDSTLHQLALGEVFISKFNSSGQVVWSTLYSGEAAEQGFDIHATQGGNVYVVGETRSPDFYTFNNGTFYYQNTIGGYNSTNPAIFDGFVLNFNSTGALIHATYYGGQEGNVPETGADKVYTVTDFFESTLYFGGLSRSADFPHACPSTTTYCFPDPNKNEEAFIVKWATGYVGIDERGNSNNMELEVYPNPTDGELTIEWKGEFSGVAELTIFDMLGKQVVNQQVSSCDECRVDLSLNLQPGVYQVQITSKNKRSTQKIVIQ